MIEVAVARDPFWLRVRRVGGVVKAVVALIGCVSFLGVQSTRTSSSAAWGLTQSVGMIKGIATGCLELVTADVRSVVDVVGGDSFLGT